MRSVEEHAQIVSGLLSPSPVVLLGLAEAAGLVPVEVLGQAAA